MCFSDTDAGQAEPALSPSAGRATMRKCRGARMLPAVMLTGMIGYGSALVNHVGQARFGGSRAGVVRGASASSLSSKKSFGKEIRHGTDAAYGFGSGSKGQSTSAGQGAGNGLIRRKAFWDDLGLGDGDKATQTKPSKKAFESPLPEGFPPGVLDPNAIWDFIHVPSAYYNLVVLCDLFLLVWDPQLPRQYGAASTLLRPTVDSTRGHFLDTSVEKFEQNKPSFWQSLRFRLKPFGRLPRSAKVLLIDFNAVGDLNLSPAPSIFGKAEVDLYALTNALKTAAHDPRVSAVWMELGADGYGAATVMEIRRAMDYFTQSGKPLWGFTEESLDINSLCIMGGCTRRFAAPEARVDLLGFSFSSDFYKGIFDKVGIEPQVRRIGEFKSFGDTYSRTTMSEAEREVSKNLLSLVSDYKTGLLARDTRGKKTMADVDALYDKDVPCGIHDLCDFGLLDDAMYEDQVLLLLREEVAKRKKVADKGEESSATGNSKKSSGGLQQRKGKTTTVISKFLIPVTTYIRKTRKNRVEGVPGMKGDKTIAIINAEGAIVNSGTPGQGNLLLAGFRQQVSDIIRDKGVDGVVVRISSPGGDALASDLIWREVRKMRESGKPVVASICDVAASGGYYIAMACEKIVCDELSLTGSIGVVLAQLTLGKVLDKVGYKVERLSKGKYAELSALEKTFTPDEDAWFSKSAMIAYNNFIGKAAMSRRMPLADMRRRAQGRVWTGTQAVELELIDEIGGLDKAVEVCRDLIDSKELAKRKADKNKTAIQEEIDAAKGKDIPAVDPSSEFIANAVIRGEDRSIVTPDDEIPVGPLGIPPERYTPLQKKIVEEVEQELQELKGLKKRVTRVKNTAPKAGGILSLLGSAFEEEGEIGPGLPGIVLSAFQGTKKPPSVGLLQGLSALTSHESMRPMAIMDDNVAKMMPGTSGVPKELRKLGVGPLMHSYFLRSPGLAEALLEFTAKVGLESLLE